MRKARVIIGYFAATRAITTNAPRYKGTGSSHAHTTPAVGTGWIVDLYLFSETCSPPLHKLNSYCHITA